MKTSDVEDLQVQKVKRGGDVTIKCENLYTEVNFIWFKQSFGKFPQEVVKQVDKRNRYGAQFNDGRFSISEDKKTFNLNIKEIKEEDSGTYFCAEELNSSLYFSSGTVLVVEGKQFYSDILLLNSI